jgi:hypothetical protein
MTMSTTFEMIGDLHAEIASTYETIAAREPAVRRPGQLCEDPASAWAVDALWSGRMLPMNDATVVALRKAAAELRRRVDA